MIRLSAETLVFEQTRDERHARNVEDIAIAQKLKALFRKKYHLADGVVVEVSNALETELHDLTEAVRTLVDTVNVLAVVDLLELVEVVVRALHYRERNVGL